jgi:hypothetical protein
METDGILRAELRSMTAGFYEVTAEGSEFDPVQEECDVPNSLRRVSARSDIIFDGAKPCHSWRAVCAKLEFSMSYVMHDILNKSCSKQGAYVNAINGVALPDKYPLMRTN